MNRHYSADQLVGMSATMVKVLRLIEVCADSDCRIILISGEAGTGKELVARTIHVCSCRRDAPFININCAAIPDHYLGKELYIDKNRSTADNSSWEKGILSRAAGGTVFFDEISNMPLFIRKNLLKMLEACSPRQPGRQKAPDMDVCVIVATRQNLQSLTKQSLLYDELFSSLNITSIFLPPLRERRECIPALVDYFIGYYNRKYGKAIRGVKLATMTFLQHYDWPGNVRELRNTLGHAVKSETSPLLTSAHLPVDVCQAGNASFQNNNTAFQIMQEESVVGNPWIMLPPEGIALEGVEKKLIEQALIRFAGNQTKAARCLGMSRDTIRYRMKKFGLSRG